jgi:exopolyphosphatase/guanosine-5'-triphosphate,3'-diphosphate pyrophosphatase
MRGAVLDLGSNTFHALVADVDEVGIRNAIVERKVAVRIGEHAFADGNIPDDACARGHAAFTELLARTGRHARVLATGVFREAANGRALLDEMTARHGVAIELLDGDDEARMTWLGVSSELAGSHGRLAVLDLGGGSLECVAGTTGAEIARSLPLGVLRLREQRPDAVRALVAETAVPALDELREQRPETVALASGTARALIRLGRKLGFVRATQRHVGRRTFGDLARVLAPLSPKAIAGFGVDPARCDTIAAGAIVLDTALELLGRPVVYVARSALREGALIEMARRAARVAA